MSSKLFPTVATIVIALAGAVTMTSALAIEATQDDVTPGIKTRAEVKAELAVARRDANLPRYGEATNFIDRTPSTKTRAEVQAELAVAQRDGNLPQYGEATQFVDSPSTLTRAEVRAETLAQIRAERAANRH
ncbi:MAG TPA: DUF4148 domain-containing protein [Albitalea sp.]|uniref:DUF4148 domain-containing protein n=1 Tax=Piscinibacter sp. TaxID=1903157 RepID=UPI002ED534AD